MSGGPRGVRHLAARLSSELRHPVATPKLRLAPEHRCPAPADDLAAAYSHIAREGLGGGHGGLRRVALWAESSGASLALAHTLRLLAATDIQPPSAIVLASPWLDLACSGGSYKINEVHDPVMKPDKLFQMALTYLDGKSPSDPQYSPLAMPTAAFALMPPTLIHVGDTEIILDDSRTLQAKLLEAGAECELKEFRCVLHAWHGFFPLMPAAEEALLQAVHFLRTKLHLPVPAGLPSLSESSLEAPLSVAAFLSGSSNEIETQRLVEAKIEDALLAAERGSSLVESAWPDLQSGSESKEST